ncbi:Mogroside IE synthase [Linum perenne]
MSPSLKGQPLATKRPHVVVIPWPAQGHINPAVQFSKTLAGKGLSVTVLTFSEKKLFQTAGILSSPVAVEQISDEGILTEPIEPDYYERYRDLMCRDLPKFIAGQSHAPPCCVVYDSLFPWVLGTARELGIMAAPFFTQPAAVNAVYMNLMEGRAAAEGFPVEMEAADLPSFVTDLESYPGTLDLMTGQLANVADADWVFCNTFYSLEEKVFNLCIYTLLIRVKYLNSLVILKMLKFTELYKYLIIISTHNYFEINKKLYIYFIEVYMYYFTFSMYNQLFCL